MVTAEQYRKELEAKHWSPEEIEQAVRVFEEAQKKPITHAVFNQIVYFLALFLSLVGNFAVSVMLIPFIVLAEGKFLYPGLFIIALAFGGLFDLIVYDLEKITEAPRFKQGLFLFAISLINIYLITQLSAYFTEIVGMEKPLTIPLITSLCYVAGFMIPHLYTRRSKILEGVVAKPSI